tara:strand:- start:364 stop:696 length:333 start_codon:yes stop_codon:yes gene_type:complete
MLSVFSIECVLAQGHEYRQHYMRLNLIVNAACASCQFKLKESIDCELAVEVNSDIYIIEDVDIDEYGNKKNINGLCKVKRKAHIIGELKQNKISISKFSLIPYKKKKKLY